MTSELCREFRATLGAVALGGAEPGEELALHAHLDGCPDCRVELAELTAAADALRLADPSRLGTGPEPPATLMDRVLDRVAHERAGRRARRRRHGVIAAAAGIAAAAVITLTLTFVGGSPAHDTRVAFPTTAGVTARATLHARSAGTEVALHVAGLKPGAYYWLWLTGADGDRIGAGSFRGRSRPTDVVMTDAIPLSETRRIWVTDAHDHIVLDQYLARA